MKRWQLKRTKVDIGAMAADMGIQQATAAVLANRKLLSRKQTHDFLYPDASSLHWAGNAGYGKRTGPDYHGYQKRKEDCRLRGL